MKRLIRAHKSEQLLQKIQQLELDLRTNNTYNLFNSVRELKRKGCKALQAVKDESGIMKFEPKEISECWQRYFCNHLNTEYERDENAINTINMDVEQCVDNSEITIEEIQSAIKHLKNRKAPGVDKISSEVLKAGGNSIISMLHTIFNKVWNEEKSPEEWSKILLKPLHKKVISINQKTIELFQLSQYRVKYSEKYL